MVFLPTASEYNGTFPSDPELFTDNFWTALRNGILRHLVLLQEHVTAPRIIGIIGLAFTSLLIYTIRDKIIDMRKMEKRGEKGTIKIDEYIKWAFGSLISAIISTAANIGSTLNMAVIIVLLSISAFILYIINPKYGILIVFKDWISSKILKNKEKDK